MKRFFLHHGLKASRLETFSISLANIDCNTFVHIAYSFYVQYLPCLLTDSCPTSVMKTLERLIMLVYSAGLNSSNILIKVGMEAKKLILNYRMLYINGPIHIVTHPSGVS